MYISVFTHLYMSISATSCVPYLLKIVLVELPSVKLWAVLFNHGCTNRCHRGRGCGACDGVGVEPQHGRHRRSREPPDGGRDVDGVFTIYDFRICVCAVYRDVLEHSNTWSDSHEQFRINFGRQTPRAFAEDWYTSLFPIILSKFV